MNKKNYSILLDEIIAKIQGEGSRHSLLLHACCAPCSSYVLEYLSKYFEISVLFYNPNISPIEEYIFREKELERLISEMPLPSDVKIIHGRYDPGEFTNIAKGLENLDEGGARCFKCYELRLREAAITAKSLNTNYFCTTLSISPHKNAERLNMIGECLGKEYGINYLYSDFKKKNGYKRSCELSEIYSLYRQDYCGCVYSKEAAKKRRL